MLLLSSADFFKNNIRVSNGLDPDQDQHSVSPDLGPNCLQRLSADDNENQKHCLPALQDSCEICYTVNPV